MSFIVDGILGLLGQVDAETFGGTCNTETTGVNKGLESVFSSLILTVSQRFT